ncbi:uncharacterized protein EI90DRAFT_3056294, partial [Cantharellus anzutake]|uniref:uncharacterized protein n=1 Tax=Cantharellus anzutake TaxID=1750568 RepID=UPI001906BE93
MCPDHSVYHMINVLGESLHLDITMILDSYCEGNGMMPETAATNEQDGEPLRQPRYEALGEGGRMLHMVCVFMVSSSQRSRTRKMKIPASARRPSGLARCYGILFSRELAHEANPPRQRIFAVSN